MLSISAFAQISIPSPIPSRTNNSVSRQSIPKESMPSIDKAAIEQSDLAEAAAGLPPRFGWPMSVNFNLNNSGVWQVLPNGDRIWRLKIEANEAKSINLLYEDFYMPPGGQLFLYNEVTGQTIGAFTNINNKIDYKFATGLIYGEQTTLEYYEPAAVTGQGRLTIGTVVHGYRYIPNPKFDKSFGDSGNCNINTVCSQGDGWRDEIKAVGLMVIAGTRWCSGALYGNTNMDCTARYVTANHCLQSFDAASNPNATTFSFIWRYESPNCTPNGGSGNDGPTNMTTVGAKVVGNNGNPGSVNGTDFAVLELTESPVNYDVYFLGWDASSTSHSSATGIHHPAGDVKKISMENQALTSTNYYGTSVIASGTHWRVLDWDSGTTEGGSSGSPLLNSTTRRAIGHLSGGDAACGNNLPDWYGQTLQSWTNYGALSPQRRMKDWLDPGNTGILAIDGYYPTNCPIPDCNDGIQNNGETGIDCGGPNCDPCPCETTVSLSITFDNYPQETSWIIATDGGQVVASGGPYPNEPDGSTLNINNICVDLDCMSFTLLDSYGDGLCCGYGSGSYILVNDLDGSTIASGASFGGSDVTDFCIDGVSLMPKIYLQGAHENTEMTTHLGDMMIPTNSPYGDGATTTASVINTYGIVDWVEVQLRSTTAPHAILAKRGALLKSDGNVVHTDGFTCVTFPESVFDGIVDGDYYVAIQHRNHLGVMTDTAYTLD